MNSQIQAVIESQAYKCVISWSGGTFIMDEPESVGGQNLGPDPYATLLASLAGCTLATLKMYADKKAWGLHKIEVVLSLKISPSEDVYSTFYREIIFDSALTEAQKERFLVIASKCPVSKILENKTLIQTSINHGN